LRKQLASPDFHKATLLFLKDDGGFVGASRRALDHAGMDRSPPSCPPLQACVYVGVYVCIMRMYGCLYTCCRLVCM
jgi:hypothetical protein